MSLNLIGTGITGASPIIKNFQDSDFKNILSVLATYPIARGGSGPTAQAPISGRIFNLTTTATVTNNLQLLSTQSGAYPYNLRTLNWSSSNTGIAVVNSGGYVTQTGNGAATIYCQTFPPNYIAPYTNTFVTSGGASSSVFSGWQLVSPVSLPYHINSGIDALISGAGTFTGSKLNLYSSTNDMSGIYTRNTSVWTSGVNLTAIPVWTSYDTSFQTTYGSGTHGFFGALVTPTDMIVAYHVASAISSATLRFVGSDNVTYIANGIGSPLDVNGDLALVHIQWSGGSKPAAVSVMPVLPSNYTGYCPDHNLNYFPVILTNQFRQVFVQDAASFGGGFFNHNPAIETNRLPWTATVIGGDSSNPVMTIINGQAVLICCTYTAQMGPNVGDNISAINSGLATLDAGGTVYTLTTPNMTSPINFPTY